MLNWTRILFFLCSAARLARCCDWLPFYGELSKEATSLLDQMGGQITDQECPVSFPDSLYRHIRECKVEEKLVFIRDSLKLISNLYHHGNLSSVTWDANKTEHFLISMDRQAEEINTCMRSKWQMDRKTSRRLARYYKKLLRSTLYKMGSSAASWELIRKETRHHLVLLDLLQASVPRSPPS